MGYTNENVQFVHITEKRVGGEGWLDQFLTTTRAHLTDALTKNEITNEGVGAVLAGVIPGMTQQAVDFELRKDLVALNIDIEKQKLALLEQEFEIKERQITETERMGKAQRSVMEREMLDKETNSLKSRELQEREVVDKELTGTKERLILEEQERKLENDNKAWTNPLKILTDDQNLIRQQALEVERKEQFYDDKILIEMVTKQADLASFAVNANSDSAQATIDKLNGKMNTTEARVKPVGTPPTVYDIVPTITNLSVGAGTNTDTNLVVSWTGVPEGDTYKVYRDNSLIGQISGTTFTDVSLTPGTKYSYAVVTVSDSSGSSAYSYSVTGVTTGDTCPVLPSVIPTVPTVTEGTITATAIEFTWAAITGATSYAVYRDGVLQATTTTAIMSDSGLVASTKYGYSIVVTTTDGTGGFSNTFAITTTA